MIDAIIAAAEFHGKDESRERQADDLQVFLRAAWTLMTTEQRAAFLGRADVVTTYAIAKAIDDHDSARELQAGQAAEPPYDLSYLLTGADNVILEAGQIKAAGLKDALQLLLARDLRPDAVGLSLSLPEPG